MQKRTLMDILDNLHIILHKTRFPENIGMCARACANMGAASLCVVQPELWNKEHQEKARALATAKGHIFLDTIKVMPNLADALAPHTLVVGTTARTGGWRRDILMPEQAAHEIITTLHQGNSVALVMGAEDRGLDNEAIERCHRLVTIPTTEAASLNVAQALLIVLYECAKAGRAAFKDPLADKEAKEVQNPPTQSPRISAADHERLYEHLKDMLLRIDFVHGDNPDYFLMPLRRFLGRAALRRHEYDALMGLCRQIRNKCK